MEDEVSSILTAIREKSNNVLASHLKHYPCHLRNVSVDVLELLELVLEKESDDIGEGSDGKQVRVPYRGLFNPPHSEIKLKPTAVRKTIVIQGEAAVGKTVLCTSIVEDWASGKLFQEFQIVLLLPLSSSSVASASSLSGLLNVLYTDFKVDTCSKVASYLKRNRQHNVLIIADGWEELQAAQCQTGSFLHSLLFSTDVIPTSSVTVLITSRPGCVQMNDTLQSVNRLITLTGFDRKALEAIVQSEFASDFKRVRYLTAQLNDNPLVARICGIPLNFAIVCHQCQSSDAEPLPNTITGFYSKLIWTLASASIKNNDPHESSLSSHHDLPDELQQSWWQVCELAFRNIEKGHNTYSPSDAAAFISSEKRKKISYFGMIKPISVLADSRSDSLSFSFLHPHFKSYLAALHLAKQPQEAQLKFMRELVADAECKTTINFWHFFITNYTRVVLNVNPDIIVQVLKILSTANKQKYCMDLCHLSYEAKNNVVNQKVVEAISLVDSRVLRFGHSRNVYDCTSIVYVLQNVTQECKVEINFQDCNLKPEHINHLANALQEKSSIVQVRGLNLSGNKLSNSLAVDFFSKAAAALKSLKILILRKCDIGTTLDIKAILSALTEPSCQTLTRFDLSFNPISISFLQTLQKHIESYATFESLQNLGLKGSLKHDVTTRFLVNFSDTLSSKCKCLQRLDLSDNNLGEPGNPDLSKIISQLLSLGRDFNLCLNEEYMSEVHDEFVCVMEESIKKKGTINHTIAHGVIVGPGRSGKNTLMSRLMGNGPPEPDAISPSTGVLENIVKVEVKKLSTVATAVSSNNLEWKKLKYDEEALELIMTTARYHSVTTTVSKPIAPKYIIKEHKESPPITGYTSSFSLSKRPIGSEQKTKYKIVNLFKKLKRFNYKPGKTNQATMSKSEEKEKNAILYTPDLEPVDIFKRAVELRGMDALREHLESSWSLYLTNTGGQIEFQEHLPLLVCGPSIFFVTFPLHYDLEKPYDVRYEYPDGRVETYKSPATLLQELLQTLATISASNFTSSQQSDSEAGTKLKIFFVGTHKDCLPAKSAEEIIQRKDLLLQCCVRQTTLFDQGSIKFSHHPDQLIFTVNNLSNDDDEFQKIRSAVQKTVEKDEFTIECPSSWLILSLILRAKHKSDQILSFDKCFSIARECGITDRNELSQALSFIHSKLGLVRYYNVKDLNTLVVVDPQVLFDKITDLIVKTFTIENVDEKEIEDFRQRGIIPVAVMQKISNKSSSDSQLPFTWLTKLLNYLRIAAFFADQSGDKYFFPSALCHAPESNSNVLSHSDSQSPLLIGFKSGFCPRGIPGALIKYLMTNEMRSKRSWNIVPNKIFKNEVSFAIQAHGNITLRILPTHLEISYESEADSTEVEDSKEDELMKKTCEMAYLQIKKGMSTVTNQCMECHYFFGFYCTLGTCQAHRHPAQLEWDGKNPFKVVCKVANKRGNLPKGYEVWNLQKTQKLGKAQLDKEIDADGHGVLKHLGQIADSMAEWEGRISEELGLKPADVASIHTKHPRNLKLQSREALYIWKQRLGSEATYRKLINIFERAGYHTYADLVKNIICDAESEGDDFSDYEEPIPQPETYPHLKPSPLSSSKFTNRRMSSCDEYLLVNRANAKDLPGGDVYSQKALDSHNVSVVPMLSSKHKPTLTTPKPETTPNYPIYVGKYDYESRTDTDMGFKKGDLMYIISTDEGDWWFAHSKNSGREGYIPSNYVAEYKPLDAEEWFFGKMKLIEVEKKLMMPFNGYGSYLIRESEINPGDYSLSVRDTERIRHYKISKLLNGTFFVTRRVTFETLQDLVTYYQQQADGLCTNLIKPCAPSEEDEWEIDRRQIRLIKRLAHYNKLAEVWEGLWNGTTPVAVNTLKPGTIAVNDFFQTANLMKKIQHQNIIQLYGVCTKEEPVYIVTEFMKHKSLLEYLRGEGRSTKLPQLIDMASQVAAGMAYLEEQNIIHEDLAARNILVGENLICKVAKFELARIIDEDFYEAPSGAKFPIKWAAPETAMYNRFTIKSDVWSFGIVLYEIITYGRFPYPGKTNMEVLEVLQQGYRMPQPPGCPGKLYNIMLACWQEDPANRPTFETLQQLLEKFFTTEDGLSGQTFEEWEIDRRTIRIVRKLMSDEFVEAWEGLWNHTAVTPVVVKTPMLGGITIDEFLHTANLMKKIQHQNIIQLYGVCTKEDPLYIITEFMKHDSLLEYLHSDGRSQKLPQLIDMASQVAAGMAYLEEKNIIHKDLAARSILVGENLICKVAKLELARIIYKDFYEAPRAKFPIKWAALETNLYKRFTTRSNVWSFGIVLYEIITYGRFPYPGKTNMEVLEVLQQGYRMPQPPGCPDKLYNIMLACWQKEPANRPTFETLQWLLEEFFTTKDGVSGQAFEEWEIDRRAIRLVRKLMSNEFVEAWEGLWYHTAVTPVVVKTPKLGEIAINDTANLMRNIQHQNIVQLYGVCTKEEPVYIVTEFMKHKSLLDYLCGEGRSTKLPQLIDMASQVAAGMAYLDEQNIIHKDLAARSILVGERLKCKVANFELARKASEGICEAEESNRHAVKWAAPEVLLQNRFSIKSDVWSFGIVLYETVTYGHPPYTGMSNNQTVVALEQGYRMPQPPGCPDWLYKIMLDCWQEEPEKRPTFETLQLLLEKFFTTEDAW